MRIKKVKYAGVAFGVLLLLALTSCGSAKKSSRSVSAQAVVTEQADRLSAEDRRKYEYFFLEGVRLKEQEEYDAAFSMYERCLEIDPDAASALYEISQFYLFLQQPEKGLALLEKAVRQDPGNFWYNQALAGFYQSKNRFTEAIRVYEGMVERFPSKLEPLMVLVDLYTRVKDYPKVISALDRLEERSGKSEQISMDKFRIYLVMQDNKKAFNEIESLVKEYPNDMKYRVVLGEVYLNNGKTDEAYSTFRKILEEEPDNVMALLSMVSYYEKTNQEELYRQQLDTVLLNKKVDPQVKLGIMRQLIYQSEQTDKDSTKIISLFDSMMEQELADAQLPMLYASYLISKKMDDATVPVLWKVLEIEPENIPARLQLLSFALKEDNKPEAIRICESGLQYSPEVLEFYYYLGLLYYQQERKDAALEVFEKGVGQVTEKSDKRLVSDFYSVIGDLYQAKDMNEKAYAAYDSSLVYNPENVGTLNNYAYFLSVEKKNLDRAEEMSYRTVKAEPDNETFLDTYAWILFEKGKYAEAKVNIDNAMKNGGDKSDVVVEHCGDIYYMNGEKEKALEYWKQALEMGSESKTLKKKIELKKYISEE